MKDARSVVTLHNNTTELPNITPSQHSCLYNLQNSNQQLVTKTNLCNNSNPNMKNNEVFTNHNFINEKKNTTEDEVLSLENYTLAKKIAQQGDFSAIRSELLNRNLLESVTIASYRKYENDLSKIDFLTEIDLEIFAIIDLYDEELALHSLETYNIAKEKTERELAFGVVLANLFTREGVTPAQFFRACLLHDIGKVEIPNFVINNSINHEEMNLFLHELVINNKDDFVLSKLEEHTGEDISIDEIADLEELLRKYNLRSVHFVPVKHILSDEEQHLLLHRGFNLESSLMDIIKMHESFSEKILSELDFSVESSLAGAHHNYHGNGSPYELTLDQFQTSVDVVEIIRIADMIEALTSSRSYKKKGFSRPKALRMILEEVRTAKINEQVAYIWIDDEIKILEQDKNSLSIEDLYDINVIKKELEIIHSNIVQNSFVLQAA